MAVIVHKMFEFWLRFHWTLLLRVQLTLSHHWFRQWLGAERAASHFNWTSDGSIQWRIYVSPSLSELINPSSKIWWYTIHKSCGCRGYDRYDEAFPLGSLSVNPCMKISQINFVWEGLMESWTNDWIVSKRQFTYLKSTVYLRIFENMVAPIFWWLQLRHNERDGVSNHRRLNGLLKRLFRRRSTKTSKLRVIGLWEWNSPVTGNFPSQRASNAESVSIWWSHHVTGDSLLDEKVCSICWVFFN